MRFLAFCMLLLSTPAAATLVDAGISVTLSSYGTDVAEFRGLVGDAVAAGLSEDEALINADTAVHDLNRTMDIELPEDEGVTINGLIQSRVGSMAKQGDQVEIGPVTLIVERASDREIITARIIVDRSFELDESDT